MLVSLSCDVRSQRFSYARFKHEPTVFVSKEFTVSELYRSSRYLKDTLAYLSDNHELFVSIIDNEKTAHNVICTRINCSLLYPQSCR